MFFVGYHQDQYQLYQQQMLDFDSKITQKARDFLLQLTNDTCRLRTNVLSIDSKCKESAIKVTRTARNLSMMKHQKALEQNKVFTNYGRFALQSIKQSDDFDCFNSFKTAVTNARLNLAIPDSCAIIFYDDNTTSKVDENGQFFPSLNDYKQHTNEVLNSETNIDRTPIDSIQTTSTKTGHQLFSEHGSVSTPPVNQYSEAEIPIVDEATNSSQNQTEILKHNSLFSSDSDSDNDFFTRIQNKNALPDQQNYESKKITESNTGTSVVSEKFSEKAQADSIRRIFSDESSDSDCDLFAKNPSKTIQMNINLTEKKTNGIFLSSRTDLTLPSHSTISNRVLMNRARGPLNRRLPSAPKK